MFAGLTAFSTATRCTRPLLPMLELLETTGIEGSVTLAADLCMKGAILKVTQ